MPTLVVSALSTFDNKGLKKAKKEVGAFEKQIKSFGKVFAGVFAASALLNYSKKAVAAFSADQAAAKALEVQLKNTGFAFSAPDVEYYIANLQKMTGVLDDHLRPAFQTLLTATGSITESQKALNVALDTSAATGKSLEEVSTTLAAGYNGQTKGLKTLGVHLTATALQAGHMAEALDLIGGAYSGQAKARLDTFQGQLDIFQVSAANASETIGKGITDALSKLNKNNEMGKLGSALEKVATTIANIVVALGAVLGKVVSIGEAIFTKLHLDKIISFLYNSSLISLLSKFGASQTDQPTSNFTYSLGANAALELQQAQELKARKALNAQLVKEAELKKLQNKYDLERIGLMAALMQATDDETKKRLAEKLAILDGDASLVDNYLSLADSFGQLSTTTNILSDSVVQAANAILTAGQKVLLGLGVNPTSMTGSAISPNTFNAYPGSPGLSTVNPNISTNAGFINDLYGVNPNYAGASSAPVIEVVIAPSVDNGAFTKAVQIATLTNARGGLTTVPAGQGF